MVQSLVLTVSWILLIFTHSIALSDKIRGAAPSFDASVLTCAPFHRPTAPQVAIALSRINDDFCDCADGADEPGTSSCENGRFWCVNKAHRGRFIPSAWVDDGNCDCCDGSDESAGKCTDTCASGRAAALKSATEAAARIIAGVRKRRSFARLSSITSRDEAKQLASARLELADVSKKLERCTRHTDGLRARQDAMGKRNEPEDTYDSGDDHVPLNDGTSSGEDASSNDGAIDDDASAEDDSFSNSDDEGKYEDGEESDLKMDSSIRNNKDEEPSSTVDTTEKDNSELVVGDSSDNASGTIKTDLEPFCEELSLGSGNSFIQKTRLLFNKAFGKLQSMSPRFFEKNGLASSKGLDKCIEQAEEKKSSLESRKHILEDKVSSLEKNAGYDYGPDGALRQLQGKCIKKKLAQYEFEHCPYDVVKQYEHGRLIAQLGRFKKLNEAGEMLYNDGAACWNGPDRSVKVMMKCGENEEVISVDEPSRCTYNMIFLTSAVCEEAEAKRILAEAGVDDMSKEEL